QMRAGSFLHRHRQLCLGGLAGAAFLGTPVLVNAQDGQGETILRSISVEAESDSILVQDGYVAKTDRIGTKTDTPLLNVPQSVTVVTQDQIEDQRPRTLNEALSYAAGANPNSFGFDSRYDA